MKQWIRFGGKLFYESTDKPVGGGRYLASVTRHCRKRLWTMEVCSTRAKYGPFDTLAAAKFAAEMML